MNENDFEKKESTQPEEPKEQDENFAEMFSSYLAQMKDDLRVGEKITGRIISIGKDDVIVSTGTKADGVVEKAELTGEDGEFPYKVGDSITLYVVHADESEVRLSKVMTGKGGIEILYDAHADKVPIEGRVIETCKGGFRVKVAGKTAFCPVSQMDVHYIEEPEKYVGQTLSFLVTRIESGGRNIVLSRRELVQREIEENRNAYLKTVSAGDVVDGRVTRVMPYGAFVELVPGLEGMIHVSELSWSRIEKPEQVVSPGDLIKVKILSIEQGSDPRRPPKISLSVKHVTGDPWNEVTSKYMAGQRIEGIITRCADFGAFVEIEPGVEGLIHISELSYKKRVVKASDMVAPGDRVAVMIKSIDPENRRISLSLKDAEGDPWIGIHDRYRPGQATEGIIKKKEDFGWFVALEPGIVGLLPKSRINQSPDAKELEKLKINDPIVITIDKIDEKERRISLSPGSAAESRDWKKFVQPATKYTDSGSILAEKLKAALKDSGKK